MEGDMEAEREAQRPVPLSPALVLFRVFNGILLFCLPLIVGAFCYILAVWHLWSIWALVSHLVTFFNIFVALKQYKVLLLRLSVIIHAVWAIVTLILAIIVGTMSVAGESAWASRIGVPMVLFIVLMHLLSAVLGWKVLREPVRMPNTMQTSAYRRTGHFEFQIADEGEEEELDDLDDGLGTVTTLHATAPTPVGFVRYLPLIMQVLATLQCILWPFYFLDIIMAFMFPESWFTFRVLLGITVTYHYAMLIWNIGCVVTSYRFKNKSRMQAAAWAAFAYLLFCFALAILKFALWSGDRLSPMLTIVHIILLGAWCICARYIGINTFDYSTVPVCCCVS